MPRFVAITSRGLIEPLAKEITSFGIKKVKTRGEGVEFEGSWADLYLVHMKTMIASRILLPVSDFKVYNQDDLYFGIYKKHDFTKYIHPRQTFRIEAHVRENRALTDQRFVAMKVKDAIVDQFRKKYDERPDIGDERNADLRVVVRIVGLDCSVAIDLTGESMAYRGYRTQAGEAPLRENVAAGLLSFADWQAPTPLVDPFCGSGTILIEAALRTRGFFALREFAFERLANFQREVFENVAADEEPELLEDPATPYLFGFDKDASVIAKARENARTAGVDKWIHFETCDVAKLKAPVEKGMIITNPPYGERLEDVAGASELMNTFSKTLKTEFKGWDCWILNGNPEVIKGLRLKAERKVPVWNAQIDCRFLRYPIS